MFGLSKAILKVACVPDIEQENGLLISIFDLLRNGKGLLVVANGPLRVLQVVARGAQTVQQLELGVAVVDLSGDSQRPFVVGNGPFDFPERHR